MRYRYSHRHVCASRPASPSPSTPAKYAPKAQRFGDDTKRERPSANASRAWRPSAPITTRAAMLNGCRAPRGPCFTHVGDANAFDAMSGGRHDRGTSGDAGLELYASGDGGVQQDVVEVPPCDRAAAQAVRIVRAHLRAARTADRHPGDRQRALLDPVAARPRRSTIDNAPGSACRRTACREGTARDRPDARGRRPGRGRGRRRCRPARRRRRLRPWIRSGQPAAGSGMHRGNSLPAAGCRLPAAS